MSFTLSELLEDVYAELDQLQVSTATGGTTASLEDSKLRGSGQDDDWKGGALIILEADGEAPQGEFSAIAGYSDSSGTFNLAEALSAAPEAGDTYGLVSAAYPLGSMLRLITTGLRALGDLPLVEQIALEGDLEGQDPTQVSWGKQPPTRIELGIDAGRGPVWQRLYDWEYLPASPGTEGMIVFGEPLPEGSPLRISYNAPHPRINAFDDVIAEVISPSLAVAAGVEQALRWANSRLGGGDGFMLQRWNDAKHTLEQARLLYPIWRPARAARMRHTGMGVGR